MIHVVSRLVRWLQDLSIRKKLYILLGILAFNLVAVISLSIFGMEILSEVRAYVGGEGLWAKAQKNAIYSLSKYAQSGQEKDYQDYLTQLRAPLGDRKARLELSKLKPDFRISDEGFLEGQNHPEDLRGMAILFRRYHQFGHINRAVQIWAEADEVLLELQDFGSAFHALPPKLRSKPSTVVAFIARLDVFNERLTILENAFSSTMGEAARWAQSLLLLVMAFGSLVLGLLSLGVTLAISSGVVRGITLISDAASRAEQGELNVHVILDSKDELGRLAAAFNAMTDSLARIDQLKNNFISTISHELRTPLTLNLAPLEALRTGEYGPVTQPQAALLNIMHNNCMRLLQMVNGMLDFSKLQAGKMPVSFEPVDMVQLCKSITADFHPTCSRKELTMDLQVDEAMPALLMDRYLFERILFNLLSNAVKFTPAGGRIRVELNYELGLLNLRVADTGIGISEDDAKGLFKKFSQAEASSTRRFEGTGLGLALVKEYAQLLGGTVRLDSKPAQGSVFTLSCPGAPAPLGSRLFSGPFSHPLPVPGAVEALEIHGNAPFENRDALPKVLIAEDNPELAMFMVSLLSGSCQLRTCADGVAALEQVIAWKPDLLLSDVMMPNKDGLALCREVKAATTSASMPVILLTALTAQEDLMKGWEAGADDYLFKPFHPRELQARVRTMLAMVAWRQRSERHRLREESLELFTRIASHDLKAPLRRIASYSQLLTRDAQGKLDDESMEYLDVITRGAEQVYSLLESLVQYSRIDFPEAAVQACDMGSLLRDVLKLLGPALEEKNAVLEIAELPSVRIVREQAFALFQNLISNSLKYRSPQRAPRIAVTCTDQGARWLFCVDDNGIGFDPVHREEVFMIFKRLHAGGDIPGDGMGLAIARKIVELHGGKIWAEPRPGEGCSIYFSLPRDVPGADHG